MEDDQSTMSTDKQKLKVEGKKARRPIRAYKKEYQPQWLGLKRTRDKKLMVLLPFS